MAKSTTTDGQKLDVHLEGFVAFHDFKSLPGVTRTVRELMADKQIEKLKVAGNMFMGRRAIGQS